GGAGARARSYVGALRLSLRSQVLLKVAGVLRHRFYGRRTVERELIVLHDVTTGRVQERDVLLPVVAGQRNPVLRATRVVRLRQLMEVVPGLRNLADACLLRQIGPV